MRYMPKSKSNVHLTPDEVKEKVLELWGIDWDSSFDPCPLNPQFDGLKIRWRKINCVNPPYEDEIKRPTLLSRFVDKALLERCMGNTSVMLLPSKTEQSWFQRLWNIGLIRKETCYFFDHRLTFKNDKWNATQPHFLVRITLNGSTPESL